MTLWSTNVVWKEQFQITNNSRISHWLIHIITGWNVVDSAGKVWETQKISGVHNEWISLHWLLPPFILIYADSEKIGHRRDCFAVALRKSKARKQL